MVMSYLIPVLMRPLEYPPYMAERFPYLRAGLCERKAASVIKEIFLIACQLWLFNINLQSLSLYSLPLHLHLFYLPIPNPLLLYWHSEIPRPPLKTFESILFSLYA